MPFKSVPFSAANSAISNKGDLGSVLKDVFSSESMQGYVLSGLLGGIGAGLGYNPTELGFDLNSAGQVVLKTGADTLVQTGLQGGSLGDNFVNNLMGAVIDIGGALAANKIGNLNLVEGSPTKIAAHALVVEFIDVDCSEARRESTRSYRVASDKTKTSSLPVADQTASISKG